MSRLKTITISVQQHHIDKGQAENNQRCPIVLAIQVTPDNVYEWIVHFDKGEKVQPFTFCASLF